ncbi:MAG TPA: hypothetical protein GX738_06720 [Firmicutes bacterium]|nr:hypothetical protein [Bacillota bacterium]
MSRKTNSIFLGTLLIVFGCLGLAANLGYIQLGLESLAFVLLALGGYFLVHYLNGNRGLLFPALLFIFLSVPFWFTLKGFDHLVWVQAGWVLAPGLAFLGASLQGGPYSPLAIPGGIITAVGLFIILEDLYGISFETVIATGLIVAGVVLLWRSQRS